MEMKRFFKRPDVEGRLLLRRSSIRGGDRRDEERMHSRAHTEPVVPAGELAERTDAKLREPVAHFLGEGAEVGDHHLRLASKFGPQRFVLSGDAHRASIEMALPRHY